MIPKVEAYKKMFVRGNIFRSDRWKIEAINEGEVGLLVNLAWNTPDFTIKSAGGKVQDVILAAYGSSLPNDNSFNTNGLTVYVRTEGLSQLEKRLHDAGFEEEKAKIPQGTE